MIDFAPNLTLSFDPYIPWIVMAIFAAAFASLLVLSSMKKPKNLWPRLLAVSVLFLVLANPVILHSDKDQKPTTVLLVVDQSASQAIGEREKRANQIAENLKEAAKKLPFTNLQILEIPQSSEDRNETKIFSAIKNAFSNIPESQRAGVIVLSDGQIHDAPAPEHFEDSYGPVNLFISGDRDEYDRHIALEKIPSYAITGQETTLTLSIRESRSTGATSTLLSLTLADGKTKTLSAPLNESFDITLTTQNAGDNIFQLSIPTEENEITALNNKTAVNIQGVRDRMRVLLVSGKPNIGSRTWRDLLTSDPSIELIHFTILRDPKKIDTTPQNELSLIPFPFRELFEEKLYDFDLIILDQYEIKNILRDYFFANIARYVREGGALMEVSGPAYASSKSIAMTSLIDVLPATPTGQIIQDKTEIKLTKTGKHHPVTEFMKDMSVAPWFRQIDVHVKNGIVLLENQNQKPLLILDRTGNGRVAQITSDQIWLWAKGFNGGGPYHDFLKRTIHWLMKEPSLDEEKLSLKNTGNQIHISKYNPENKEHLEITVQEPDGAEHTLSIPKGEDDRFSHLYPANAHGLYEFKVDGQSYFSFVGDMNAAEFSETIATKDKLKPIVKNTGGKTLWFSNAPSGERLWNSINLRERKYYTRTNLRQQELIPDWLELILVVCIFGFAWHREGKNT